LLVSFQRAATALRKGRAIPMLIEHHPPEMPDHALTVIGLLDTLSFEGAFIPDDFSGGGLVRMALPDCPVDLFDIKTDSADAKAVHELWTKWHGGACERYLGFVRAVAVSLSLVQLNQVLESATPVESPAGKSPKQGARSKPAGAKRRATKGKRSGAAADRRPRVVEKQRKRRSA
jgi:hypothetical protein